MPEEPKITGPCQKPGRASRLAHRTIYAILRTVSSTIHRARNAIAGVHSAQRGAVASGSHAATIANAAASALRGAARINASAARTVEEGSALLHAVILRHDRAGEARPSQTAAANITWS